MKRRRHQGEGRGGEKFHNLAKIHSPAKFRNPCENGVFNLQPPYFTEMSNSCKENITVMNKNTEK